jgi:hypothetical protein
MDILRTLPSLVLLLYVFRILLLIKIDRTRNRNIFFKLIFGAYAFEGMVPILRRTKSREEQTLMLIANGMLVLLYLLMILFFVIAWIIYK